MKKDIKKYQQGGVITSPDSSINLADRTTQDPFEFLDSQLGEQEPTPKIDSIDPIESQPTIEQDTFDFLDSQFQQDYDNQLEDIKSKYGDITDPQRIKDLDNLARSMDISKFDISQIKFSAPPDRNFISEYFNPKPWDGDNLAGIRMATLPDGNTVAFTDKDGETQVASAYNTVTGIKKAVGSWIPTLLEVSKNILTGVGIGPVPGIKAAANAAEEGPETSIFYTPWTNKFKESMDEKKVLIAKDDEWIRLNQEYYDKKREAGKDGRLSDAVMPNMQTQGVVDVLDKILDDGLLFESEYWKRVFTDEFYNDQVIQGLESAIEFMGPGAAVSKLGLASKAAKLLPTGTIGKLNISQETLKNVGKFGDIFSGGYFMGAMESHIEGIHGAESIATERYNKSMPEGNQVHTIEELEAEPDSPAKQDALKSYNVAYADLFNANVIPLTLLNTIPVATIANKGFLGNINRATKGFSIRNPRLSATVDTGLNMISEGSQEVYQTGVEQYERAKIVNGVYPLDNNVLEDIWGGIKTGVKGFGENIETTDSFLLGAFTAGATTTLPSFFNADKQRKMNHEIAEILKGFPESDFASLQGLTKNKELDYNQVISKINNLNSFVINEEFSGAASRIGNPELVDYAYQQSVSGLVYDALNQGVDIETVKENVKQILDKHIKQGKNTVEDSDGSMVKYDKFLAKKMELIDQLADAANQTNVVAKRLKLPEKNKKALFTALIGYNYFSDLAGKLDIELEEAIDNLNGQRGVNKYEEFIAKESGQEFTPQPDENLKGEAARINRKLISAQTVANKYAQTVEALSKKEHIAKAKRAATVNKVVQDIKTEFAKEATPEAAGVRERVTQKVVEQNPEAEVKEVISSVNKEQSAIVTAKQNALALEIPTLAANPGVTYDELVNPEGKQLEGWEKDIRKNLANKELERQRNDAEKAPAENRYDGRPLLFEHEATKAIFTGPGLEQKIDAAYFQQNPGKNPTGIPYATKLKDKAWRDILEQELKAINSVRLENQKPPLPETIEVDPKTFFDESDSPTTLEEIVDVKPKDTKDTKDTKDSKDSKDSKESKESKESNKPKVKVSDDKQSVTVYHKKLKHTNEDIISVRTIYTINPIDWFKGISYLHMGKLNNGDILHLEVEPGLSRNRGNVGWENLTIQVVTYDKKGRRVVIGALKKYSKLYFATPLLEEVRKDIFKKWVNNQGQLIKPGWQTTVTNIYKGHADKVRYNSISGMPITGDVLREAQIDLKKIEVGLVGGKRDAQWKVSTNNANFTVIQDRNTKDEETGTGFPVLLMKTQKKSEGATEDYYEQFSLWSRLVKDIPGFKQKILELLEKGDEVGVGMLVSNKRLVLEKDPTDGRLFIKLGGNRIYNPQQIYDRLDLGSFPVHIDRSWISDYNVRDEIVHPVFGRKDVKDIILNHLSATDIGADQVNQYSYEGETENSFIHSSKPKVEPWFKRTEAQEIIDVTKESPAESTTEPSTEQKEPAENPQVEHKDDLDIEIDIDFKVREDIPVSVFEDEAKFKKWFKARLEEIGYIVNDKELEKLHGLLKLDNTQKIWGIARGAAVILASNRPVGTTKHEAFHIVFNLFLTPEQRAQAYTEVWNEVKDTKKFKKYSQEDFEKALHNHLTGTRFSVGKNQINYVLKSADILQSQKAIDWFKKRDKAQWKGDLFYTKLSSELGIPKDQVEILKGLNLSNPYNREELLSNLLANYGFEVEVNTSTQKYAHDSTDPVYGAHDEIIHEGEPTQYYSNMTSPGGTNYRELRFTTPGIEPSIKGHAEFATKNDIGWARVDEQAVNKSINDDSVEDIDLWGAKTVNGETFISTKNPTKTRRVLEIQSDLFQKGRDKDNLVNINKRRLQLEKEGYSVNDAYDIAEKEFKENSKENKFLQLLNKDNTWVTFFVKSLIQDSIKNGYEKVLFPGGDTASKIEGHTTLEEFKRQKEERIKQLEKQKSTDFYKATEGKFEGMWLGKDKAYRSKEVAEESWDREINTLKNELKRIEGPEGLKAFAPINFFYGNTVRNIVDNLLGGNQKNRDKGIFAVKEITDEYGNKWFEVDLSKVNVDPIRLKTGDEFYEERGLLEQLEEIMANGFENFKLGKIFPDSFNTRFPKTTKILNDLYNFLFKQFDILKQYFTDDIKLRDLYRRIENNSLGRDFFGNRRKKFGEIISRNLANAAPENFKITKIPPVRIAQRISFINKDLIQMVLEKEEVYRKDGKVQSLYDAIYSDTPGEAIENLIKVYEYVKGYIENQYIPSAKRKLANATDEKSRAGYQNALDSYNVLLELLSFEYLRGEKDLLGSEAFEFTKRLVKDLAESQGVIFDGKQIVTDEVRAAKEEDEDAEYDEDTSSDDPTVSQDLPKDSHERWQVDIFSEKSFERISPRLKGVISKIPMTKDHTLENGKVVKKKLIDDIGGTIYHNSRVIYNLLVEKLASIERPEYLLEELKILEKTDDRLAEIAKLIIGDKKLMTDVWNGISNKYQIAHDLIKVEKGENDGYDKILMYNSARQGVVEHLVAKFNTNFNFKNWDQNDNARYNTIGTQTFEDFRSKVVGTDVEARKNNLPILLSDLGFTITDKAAEYLKNLPSKTISDTYEDLRFIVDLMDKGINPTIYEDAQGRGGAQSKIKNIATILRDTGDNLDLKMFTNGKNKLVSGHVQVGYVVKLFHRLKNKILDNPNKESRDANMSRFEDETNFIFKRDAPIVRWIKEKKSINLRLSLFDSRKRNEDEEGQELTEMSPRDMHIMQFEAWLADLGLPKNRNIKYSWEYDKSFRTTNYNIAVYDSPNTYWIKLPILESYDDIYSELSNVFLQEANRIKYIKDKKALDPNYTTEDANMDANGEIFHFFPGLPYDSILDAHGNPSWALARPFVEDYMETKFQRYQAELGNLGLIRDGEYGIEPTYDFPNPFPIFGNFESTLKLFFFNDWLMSSQTITLLSGDPAFYKTNKTDELTSVDFQKRNKPLHSNGIYPYFDSVDYKVQYILDIKKPSTEGFISDVEKAIKKYFPSGPILKAILDRYREAHEYTDAQGYITLDRWKEIKVALNEWSDQHEESYTRLKAGKELTTKDKLIVTQPLKPHMFNFVANGEMSAPTQHKYSAIVLHTDLVKDNPILERIMQRMEKEKTSELIFVTGVKTGIKNPMTLEDYLNLENKSTNQVIPSYFWKEQQKVPEHYNGDTDNLLGIQLRKLILANIARGVDYVSEPLLVETFNSIFNTKLKALKGVDVVRLVDYVQAANINIDRANLNSELNNFTKFRNKLLASIDSKGLGSQISDPLELKSAEKFKLPLAFPLISRKIEEIINSFFKKVSKQRHNGGSYVNVSGLGFTNKSNNEGLRIVVNDDGTFHVEVAMSMNSNLMGVNLKTGEIEKIQYGIVYRIPTEEKYSMFPIKVVRWLEPSVGGIIAMPLEVTSIAGLDFDIDKVYSLAYNYKIDKRGYINVPKNLKSREGRENILLDLYRGILTHNETFKDFIRPQSIEPLRDLRDDIRKDNTKYDIVSITSRIKFMARNLAGKNLIGIFATNNSFHALAMDSGARVDQKLLAKILTGNLAKYLPNPEDKTRLPNKIYGELDRDLDLNGNQISRSFAMLLSAAVDNAKDPVLEDLNINTFTAPMLSLLLHLGVPMNEAIIRINQKDMLDESLSNSSGIVSEQNIVNQEVKNIFRVSKSLGRLISALRVDSGVGPTLHDVDKKINDIILAKSSDTILSGNLLPNIDLIPNVERPDEFKYSITDDAGVSLATKAYINVLLDEANFARKYFPYFNANFTQVKDSYVAAYTSSGQLSSKNRRTVDIEHIGILHYKLFDIVDPINFMQAFPTKFFAFTAEYPLTGKYKDLVNVFTMKKGMLVPFDKNQLDPPTQELIKEQWESMLIDDTEVEIKLAKDKPAITTTMSEIAKDLIRYGFIVNGYNYTRDSYLHLVPSSFFENDERFSNFDSGLAPHLIAFNIVLNNPTKFLPKFPKNFKLTAKTVNQLVSRTQVIKGEEVQFFYPMYYTKNKGQISIFVNKDLISGSTPFAKPDELTTPSYTELLWKDENIKGRTYDFSFNLLSLNQYEHKEISEEISNFEKATLINDMNEVIDFQEEPTTGYRNRTIKNASADATIAIAVDFNSDGEKLTKTSVLDQGKKYIPIDANSLEVTEERVNKIVEQLNTINKQSLSKANIPQNLISGIESFGTKQEANAEAKRLLGNNPHSIDMIEAGLRTRTTRSVGEMQKYNVKVGDIVTQFGKSADGTTKQILTKITAIHLKGTPGFFGTWSKEGWTQEGVEAIKRFKDGAAAIEFEIVKPTISLNIAGNGIYTMKGKYTQEQVDNFTYELLNKVINSPNLKNKISLIRTGGQTGFDEAGAKAGVKLKIPTMILAPKGWTFRNASGQDISNEAEFKARFSSLPSTRTKTIVAKKTEFTSEEIKENINKIYPGFLPDLPCK